MTNQLILRSKSPNQISKYCLWAKSFVPNSKKYAQNNPLCCSGVHLLSKNQSKNMKYLEDLI